MCFMTQEIEFSFIFSSISNIFVWVKGADPLILVKISLFFFLLENSFHVWGHYVLNFYKAIATRNAPKKGPKNGGFR